MPSILESSERADLRNDQTAFNLAVWQDVLAASWLADQPGKIETI